VPSPETELLTSPFQTGECLNNQLSGHFIKYAADSSEIDATSILKTELGDCLIEYYWEQEWMQLFFATQLPWILQAGIYIYFSYVANSDHNYEWVIIISMIILFYLFVKEILMIKSTSPRSYIHNINNISSLILIISHIIFCYFHYAEHDKDVEGEILTGVIFIGILKGGMTIFTMFHYTRFLVYMVVRTIAGLLPFILFLVGQQIHFAAVFTHSDQHGENFHEDGDDYENWSKFPRSYFKTLDFTMGKDNYKFTTGTGATAYTLGMLYLNVIILNLVIALVGDVYDSVMTVKHETELKLKAEMLVDLYNLKSSFLPQSKVVGNFFIFRLVHKPE